MFCQKKEISTSAKPKALGEKCVRLQAASLVHGREHCSITADPSRNTDVNYSTGLIMISVFSSQ